MRVISGHLKGRKILSPEGYKIRPTSDRAKEMIFNTLNSIFLEKKKSFSDMNVLDLFCGSGALGIESISRGANSVTFVDESKEAITLVKTNCLILDIQKKTNFLRIDLKKLEPSNKYFDLFFLDPPYKKKLITQSIELISEHNWIKKFSIGVIEVSRNNKLELPKSVKIIKIKKVGVSNFFFINIS